jgi:hypothetical protein
MKARTLFLGLTVASATSVAGCSAPEIAAPKKQEAAHLLGLPILRQKLIECPTSESFTESAVITTRGGLISVGGMSISIPAGALLTDALMTVTVPASKYVEVEIRVEGVDHFIFELPVVVTMSYARCTRSNINIFPLSAWYIDSETKALLEKMASVDDKLLRTVTFPTTHLSSYAISGYAVANAEK